MAKNRTESITSFIAVGGLVLAMAAAAAGYLNHSMNGPERTRLVCAAMVLYWFLVDVAGPIISTKVKTSGKKVYIWNLFFDLAVTGGISCFLYGTGAGGGVKAGLTGAVITAAAMKAKSMKSKGTQA